MEKEAEKTTENKGQKEREGIVGGEKPKKT